VGRRLGWPAVFAACVLGAGAASLWLGQDTNWDLRNYHYYNAWSLLHGRWAIDVAPAQMQSFHNPLPDLPFYFLAGRLPARAVAIAMAASTAIAAYFLVRIAVLLVVTPARAAGPWGPGLRRGDMWVSIAAAVAVGVTGAAGVAVIGSTMNEWPSTAFVMASLYLALRGRLGWAGFLMGCATGFKLTYAVYALGLVAGLATWGPWRERAQRAARAAAFMALGFLATHGPWSAFLWHTYGNPVFPYFNAVFRSESWLPTGLHDDRFGPRTLLQAIAFPLYFARDSHGLVSSVGFRDYRLATLWVLGVACLVRALARRESPPAAWRLVAAFALVSYLAWLKLFAIYRYLIPLEMLSGPLVVAGVLYLVRAPRAALAVTVVLTALLIGTTRKMGWERTGFGERYFEVSVPAVEEGALVVLAPHHPMAYAAPFFPGRVRFVSPWNNFLVPGQATGLARAAASAIEGQDGPLYLLDMAQESPETRRLLEHFRLARDACRPVRSNIDADALRLCRLRRV
jgi:hypothetical protein